MLLLVSAEHSKISILINQQKKAVSHDTAFFLKPTSFYEEVKCKN